MLRILDRVKPDVVLLHNLHGHNVHLRGLFDYLKKEKIKVIWTFHDCWAFTGYCPYYDMAGCDKWEKGGCGKCPLRRRYSWLFDRSRELYEKKRALYQDLDMTVVTPSAWLAGEVKRSFLKACDVRVINNGIDLSVFYPRENDFRERYHLEEKFIILGVTFGWAPRKGLDVFLELTRRLDERFQIVLVGTDAQIDKRLPNNVISIHRAQNQAELAEIYTAADLLVNPTREENYPTTHMESLACGTPVLAFDTGGCKEMLDETCGMVTPKNDNEALYEAILRIQREKIFSKDACLEKARSFSDRQKFCEYVELILQSNT
jgi:glycosyltransferase involved in cell wall biosynthesis